MTRRAADAAFCEVELVEAEGIRRLAHRHLKFSVFGGILTPTDTTRCRGLEPCTPEDWNLIVLVGTPETQPLSTHPAPS